MTHYINKSALAAEIKKLIKRYKTFQPHSSYEDGLKEGRLIGYEDALCKINTLEVKEEVMGDDSIINAAREYEESTIFSDIVLKAKGINSAAGIGFLEGATWVRKQIVEQ